MFLRFKIRKLINKITHKAYEIRPSEANLELLLKT